MWLNRLSGVLILFTISTVRRGSFTIMQPMGDPLKWIKRVLNIAYLGAITFVERIIPFLPVGWVEQLQQHRLRSIVKYAYETVPFSSTDHSTLQRQLVEKTRSVLGKQIRVEVECIVEMPRTPQCNFLRVVSNSGVSKE